MDDSYGGHLRGNDGHQRGERMPVNTRCPDCSAPKDTPITYTYCTSCLSKRGIIRVYDIKMWCRNCAWSWVPDVCGTWDDAPSRCEPCHGVLSRVAVVPESDVRKYPCVDIDRFCDEALVDPNASPFQMPEGYMGPP